MYIRAETRAGSNNVDRVLQNINPNARSGRPNRIEPSSRDSVLLRDAVRSKRKFQN